MRRKDVSDIGIVELALLGVVVHVFMILWMLTLPSPWNYKVVSKIWFPVLTLYPVGTIFLGKMLAGQFVRDKAAKALEESESKYRRMLDTANEGISAMDENFVTTFVNQRMSEMLGYSADEMLGRRVDAFMLEEELTDHNKKMQDRTQGSKGRYERRFRHKDGSPVWTIVSAVPLSDDKGSFKGSFAMFTDITEKKRAEEAKKQSEQRFRQVFEQGPLGVGMLDLDYRWISVNPKLCEILGYEQKRANQAHCR